MWVIIKYLGILFDRSIPLRLLKPVFSPFSFPFSFTIFRQDTWTRDNIKIKNIWVKLSDHIKVYLGQNSPISTLVLQPSSKGLRQFPRQRFCNESHSQHFLRKCVYSAVARYVYRWLKNERQRFIVQHLLHFSRFQNRVILWSMCTTYKLSIDL